MSFEKQVTINPDFNAEDKVELMFDFDELTLLMNDFKGGFKNTTTTRTTKGRSRKGGGFYSKDFTTTVRDYDYYRASELWEKVADKLDIDMDDDDFNDDKLSEMYSFAYDQNEEYENPTFNELTVESPDYAIDGVVPTMDISYTNEYSDAEKTKKFAFGGNRFKVGESMSLNYDTLHSNYIPLQSSSGNPEDSNFNGKSNSLYK